MANVKKYILTAVILGSIAMCAGALIGATDLITRGPIAENEKKKVASGLADIYGVEEVTITSEKEFSKEEKKAQKLSYVERTYTIADASNVELGHAFRTSGYNDYGKITLIVGFNNTGARIGVSVITNEQTFASKLRKNYINPLQNGDKEYTDIQCGATYGAKLIRDMIDEAAIALNGYSA